MTETHTLDVAKGALQPPIRDPDDPNQCIMDIPGNGFGFVSKVDGSFFTFDDIPVEPEHDPFPLQDSLSEPQDELEQ